VEEAEEGDGKPRERERKTKKRKRGRRLKRSSRGVGEVRWSGRGKKSKEEVKR